MKNSDKHRVQYGKAITGTVLLLVGTILLGNEFGAGFPRWLVSWPMLLLALGIASGYRHNFRKPGAYVLIALGSAFLLSRYVLTTHFFLAGPFVMIAIGLWFIISRHRYDRYSCAYRPDRAGFDGHQRGE